MSGQLLLSNSVSGLEQSIVSQLATLSLIILWQMFIPGNNFQIASPNNVIYFNFEYKNIP